MFRSRFYRLSTIIAALCSLSYPSCAGDSTTAFRNRDKASHQQRSFDGGDGLPSYLRNVGVYAGDLSAVRARYNGVYFSAQQGGGYLPRTASALQPKPRIIHVNRKTMEAGCSYEAGVCVIRP